MMQKQETWIERRTERKQAWREARCLARRRSPREMGQDWGTVRRKTRRDERRQFRDEARWRDSLAELAWAGTLVLGALVGTAMPPATAAASVLPASAAARHAEPGGLLLPAGSLRTSLGSGMRVHGLPLRAEVFQAPAPLQETADLIAGQPDTPPSMLVLPGAVLLAWQSGSQHWVARLAAHGQSHTRGTLSMLTLPSQSEGGVPSAMGGSASLPVWLPPHGRLLFAFDSAGGRHPMRQGVYAHDLPPTRLWPLIHDRLRSAGWRREPGDPVHGGAGRWASGSRTLTLLVVPVGRGSGMLASESGPV